jgi:hypothetical protein
MAMGSWALVGLHVVSTFAVGVVLLSFIEHSIHRHIMHRHRLPAWMYRASEDFETQFQNHAVLHHGTYYKVFDHEPSREGKYFNLRILTPDIARLIVLFSPVCIALWVWLSPASALTLGAMVLSHCLLWNAAHVQMHVPERNSWFREAAWFRLLARHHFMHHRRTNRHFNVVLPLADYLLGTTVAPRRADVREMLRLGYVRPRTAVGRRFVGKQWRATSNVEEAPMVPQPEPPPQL